MKNENVAKYSIQYEPIMYKNFFFTYISAESQSSFPFFSYLLLSFSNRKCTTLTGLYPSSLLSDLSAQTQPRFTLGSCGLFVSLLNTVS